MDRDRLRGWLDSGLSLTQIAALTDRDPSTVGYWVKKHGLRANGHRKHAARGGLTREQLEPLVESGATLREIAEEVGRSMSTVRYWLGKHGLSTKARRVNTEAATEAFQAGKKRFVGRCRRHGRTDFLLFKDGRYRCARCNSEAVARHRQKVKRELVREAGGRCVLCGFDRHLAALQFHHVDRKKKRFAIGHKGKTRAMAKSRAEARRCALLCANCHAIVEAEGLVIPLQLEEDQDPE